MRLKSKLITVFITILLATMACNAPFANSTPPAAATLNGLYTAAALTVQASSAHITATPLLSPTSPFPTYPSGPTRTPVPISYCDAAAFVKDISISDGSIIGRGTPFTKIWRIQNAGTCSWTPSYALVFVSGDQLNAPNGIALPGTVNPGQTVDLSVTMTAPNTDGEYQGFWKLRNASGILFGIGDQAQGAFWVDIHVAGPVYTAYDFAANYCDANWDNKNIDLPCPGTNGDNAGYVIKLNHPVMENGKKEDETGLLTVPRDASNGVIRGKYPAFKIKNGDRFQALVNCQYQSYSCNVIFRLDYQINGGDIQTLGQWNEIYEGLFYPVDIDLSALAGQNVRFILVVTTNGQSNQDNALWLAPRIIRAGTPPPTATLTLTSTSTPTFTPTSTETPTASPTP